jgi:hypothetical protein
MNKRIKSLIERAEYQAQKHSGSDWEVHVEPSREQILEKFTELIVRECMKESMAEIVSDENIAQESDPLHREYLKGNNQGIVDAVVRFRNYFGVEQ